jgi:hypothetical protein
VTPLELFAFAVLPLSVAAFCGVATYLFLWNLPRPEKRSGK